MRRNAGFTLIELVMSIVIIGVAVAGAFSVMNLTTARSADPMVQMQALAIAEAYLEEIMVQNYVADGVETRPTYDDVLDYNNLAEAPTDQNGTPIAGLGAYAVRVTVNTPVTVNGQAMHEVQVSVTPPTGDTITLTGYRGLF